MAAAPERSDAGAKVTVACKLPAGIVIRGYTKSSEREAVLGGGTRDFDVFRWNGMEHEVFGTAVPLGQMPKCQIVAGYALTPNVSKDLFDNWLAANRESALVRNKLIFAYESLDRVQGVAREHERAITGFEPLDPNNPGPRFRGIVKADVK